MSTRDIPVAILFSPSTTAVGKFYLACMEPGIHFALYGPNTSHHSGTHTTKATFKAFEKVVTGKTAPKGEYNLVHPNTINQAAITSLVERTLRALNLPITTPWALDPSGRMLRLTTAGTHTTPSSQQGAPVRPRTRKVDADVKIWI